MKVISFTLLFLIVSCALPKEKKKSIEESLSAKQDRYRQCYVESNSYTGRADPSLGLVMVNFTLTKEGKVKDTKIAKSDFKDANLHACLIDQIRRIDFGEVDTETLVTQPINFVPVET